MTQLTPVIDNPGSFESFDGTIQEYSSVVGQYRSSVLGLRGLGGLRVLFVPDQSF